MIDQVGKACVGCFSCVAKCPCNAIILEDESNGFKYPRIITEKCIHCNLCETTCPILRENQRSNEIPSKSYAASTNLKPETSSSGGSFYALAKYIISNSGFVCGAALCKDMTVRHIIVDNIPKLKELCGSKYIQSSIELETYKSIEQSLKKGVTVLFIGTPCQVAGLKLFLHKSYEELITIDLVCHGVPSPGIFKEYIDYCNKLRRKKITGFICRDNRDGWDQIFKSTIKFADGTEEYNTALSNLWNRIFFSELAIRPSCSECKFARPDREGDITLGDFWGLTDKKSFNQKEGVSLLLCNTEKGMRLVKSTDLELIEASTNKKNHPNLYHPTPANALKDQFIQDYNQNGFKMVCKKYFDFTSWLDFKIRLHSWLTR